ncbi:hypothetical protein [Neisseria animaloris]|nr:hypothetical protein [Neisseria animaloris]
MRGGGKAGKHVSDGLKAAWYRCGVFCNRLARLVSAVSDLL